MAQELEIKLELSKEAADRVAALPWLRELASGPAKTENLVSVYFDTKRRKLRSRGLSLRVRHVRDRRIQTIKAESSGLTRDEWEQDISGDVPDLDLIDETAPKKLKSRKLRRKLQPLFETVVERTTMSIDQNGSLLNLAIDRGAVRAGTRQQPINEVEIELKKGDPSAVTALAERLSRSEPVSFGVQSKSERGYALLSEAAGQPFHTPRVVLDPDATTGRAFTTIGLSCLKQILSNQEAVIRGDTEGIHQMRVGTRRLRAAISLFRRLLTDPMAETIKNDLKWLTDALGPAREYDVLIEEHVTPLQEAEPETSELRSLGKELQDRRKHSIARAGEAVRSERFRKLGLNTALWLVDGAWLRSDDTQVRGCRDGSAIDFAAETFGRRSRKIHKTLEDLVKLAPRRRHKLRIAIKKLRYATGFFASLFDGGKQTEQRKSYQKALKRLQGTLGILNDITVHRQIARSVTHPDRRTQTTQDQAFAVGIVAGTERTEVEASLAEAKEARRELAAAKPFWR